MIGLGGGSMAKFIYRRMEKTSVRVVEIRPEVVSAARAYFDFPPDDKRLQAIVDDGARYLPEHPESADVLLIDGFEDGLQPPALCSQDFYDAAYAALRSPGVMAVNFMAEDRKLDAMCARLEKSFAGRVLLLEAADKVNVVVLCLKGGPGRVPWSALRTRARGLRERSGLVFEGFIDSLRNRNVCTARYLTIDPVDDAGNNQAS